MLQRVVFPAGLIGTLFVGPLYFYETYNPIARQTANTPIKAISEVGPACFTGGLSAFIDCAPQGVGSAGPFLFAAFAGAIVTAAIGLVGILPILRKLGALVGAITGVIAIIGVGMTAAAVLTSEDGTTLGWGAYAAGVLGLLMVLTGLFAMRAED
ncbi:MAG: hypothetical protein AAF527_04875 [Pseudomonadota bacterium]